LLFFFFFLFAFVVLIKPNNDSFWQENIWAIVPNNTPPTHLIIPRFFIPSSQGLWANVLTFALNIVALELQ
jgi:hypothetical protein